MKERTASRHSNHWNEKRCLPRTSINWKVSYNWTKTDLTSLVIGTTSKPPDWAVEHREKGGSPATKKAWKSAHIALWEIVQCFHPWFYWMLLSAHWAWWFLMYFGPLPFHEYCLGSQSLPSHTTKNGWMPRSRLPHNDSMGCFAPEAFSLSDTSPQVLVDKVDTWKRLGDVVKQNWSEGELFRFVF